MYKAKVNGKIEFDLDLNKEVTSGTLNGEDFDIDVSKRSERQLHIIKAHSSYNVEILELDRAEKQAKILVNGNTYDVSLKDEMDQLLAKLGMDTGANKVVKELKAPMPGLVVELKVEPGQEVAKGEALLVLEAMKMENVLKAPSDVVINEIKVSAGNTIEKNTVLITFK